MRTVKWLSRMLRDAFSTDSEVVKEKVEAEFAMFAAMTDREIILYFARHEACTNPFDFYGCLHDRVLYFTMATRFAKQWAESKMTE